jgi:hypothetical protein
LFTLLGLGLSAILFFVLYQVFIPNPDELLAWRFFFASLALFGLMLILGIIFAIDVINKSMRSSST